MLITSVVAFVSTTACASADQAAGNDPPSRYVALDGKNELIADKSVFIIEPVHSQMAPSEMDGKGWKSPLKNCSTEEIRCVNADRFTFAALKGQARENETYSVNGMVFTVVKCGGDLCRTQHIVGKCDHWSGVEVGFCKPFDRDELGKESDISLAYDYEVGKGITRIEIKYGGIDLTDANRFVLSSGYALLAP
jgi:hypothetical protein